ncbi:unnamed protein product [Lota lota]
MQIVGPEYSPQSSVLVLVMVVSNWLDSPALLVQLLVAAVSLVIMVMLCLRCRAKRPLVIHQVAPSDEYVPQTTFRLIHPYQNSTGATSVPSPLLPQFSPVVPQRRSSFTPTENESIPSYIIPVEEQDPLQDDYIEVLEDPAPVEASVETQSVDSGSATEGEADYVNWTKENQDLSEEDAEDMNYINVGPLLDSASTDSDDDEEANYVNQPVIDIQHDI